MISWEGQRDDGWVVRVIVDELDPSAASVQVRAPGDHSTWQPLVELSRIE